ANAYFSLLNKEDRRIYNNAIRFLNNAIASYPMYGLARFNLGAIYFFNEEFDKADNLLNSFIMTVSAAPEEAIRQKGFVLAQPNVSYHDDLKMAWEEISYKFYRESDELSFGY